MVTSLTDPPVAGSPCLSLLRLYDAGDHMKFGFPAAFASSMLSWGYLEHKRGYDSAGQTRYLLQVTRWFTDYMVKCHVAPDVFYGQVGSVALDHDYWGRAEDMTMARPAYKITAQQPGSDLAGSTAAALASAAMLLM